MSPYFIFITEKLLQLEDQLARRRTPSRMSETGDSDVDIEDIVFEQKIKEMQEKHKQEMEIVEKQYVVRILVSKITTA